MPEVTKQAAPTMSLAAITVKPRGRKTFNENAMLELSQSIAKYGVIQPIVITTEMGRGSIPEQQRKVMYFARLTAFNYKANLCASAFTNQMMMNGRYG